MEYSVLVVDDQPENIKYISLLLKEMGLGSKIYSAPNGKIALDIVDKVNPDIILSDWGMPEMDGLGLVKKLKESPKTRDIPFIMISAVKIDAQSMKESFEAGVHDYLKKPFDKLEFMARVNATLKLHNAYLQIKKSNEEIFNQAFLITNQREQLEKLNKTKDKIFSIISHDLRSPLATFRGLLQIFGDEQIDFSAEELKDCTKTVQLELNKIQLLMDNLLFWAKSQMADEKPKKAEVNISLVVEEVLGLFSGKIQTKQIEIDNRVEEDQKIWADKNILSFVIRNLLANAIKFTSERGRITVSVDHFDNKIGVTIKDTGMGMDQKTIDTLFKDRIMTTQTGTAGEQGTGLGLLLCKDMIERIDGSIKVESKINIGSTFMINLPLQE